MAFSIYGDSGLKFKPNLPSNGSNSIDCYEEGTWTGTLHLTSSGSPTNEDSWNTETTAVGTYRKIGTLCYVAIFFDVTAYNAYSALKIIGLPYAASGEQPESAINIGHCRGIRFNYNATILNTACITAHVNRGRNIISLKTSSKSAAFTGFWYISNQSGQGKYVHVGGTYRTIS